MIAAPRWEEQQSDAIEVELLLETLCRQYGYDFRGYVRSLLVSRIQEAVAAEGAGTIAGLEELVRRSEAAADRTVLALSGPGRPLFDDPRFYRAFLEVIVPLLRTYPSVRIWQPACGDGRGAYSLAILLYEAGLLPRTQIYATEVSPAVRQAQSGRCEAPCAADQERYVASGGAGVLDAYFVHDGGSTVFREDLRAHVLFAQHSLASDHAFNQFQVIVARYVLMYLQPELQVRAQRLFSESLVRFGFLCLGRDEAIARPPRPATFEPVAVPKLKDSPLSQGTEADSIYRRLP